MGINQLYKRKNKFLKKIQKVGIIYGISWLYSAGGKKMNTDSESHGIKAVGFSYAKIKRRWVKCTMLSLTDRLKTSVKKAMVKGEA